jgi:hypothetical protein
MTLKIYENANPNTSFSISEEFSNPISHAFDGVNGGVIEKCYYVRNDNALNWYTNIKVQPIDGGDNIVDGSNGFSWKLYAGNQQPLEEQWSLVSAGNQITLSDIGSASNGDISTYLPFWVRIEVPAGSSVQSFQSVKLRINTTEGLVS